MTIKINTGKIASELIGLEMKNVNRHGSRENQTSRLNGLLGLAKNGGEAQIESEFESQKRRSEATERSRKAVEGYGGEVRR